MGTWGAGNFDNDSAGDFLDSILEQLRNNINECLSLYEQGKFIMENHGISILMPSVDIITTLCKHYESYPDIPVPEAQMWKDMYLKIYDEKAWVMGGSDDFNRERREVIVETFDTLIALIEEWEE